MIGAFSACLSLLKLALYFGLDLSSCLAPFLDKKNFRFLSYIIRLIDYEDGTSIGADVSSLRPAVSLHSFPGAVAGLLLLHRLSERSQH